MGFALPLMAIGMALSTAGTAAQAVGARRAAKFERVQYEEQAQMAKLQAEEEEAQRRQELQSVLATQEAIRAGQGLDPLSGTGQAIRRFTVGTAERDIKIGRLNALMGARRYGLAAQQAKIGGKAAFTGGLLSAGAGLLSGAGNLYGAYSAGEAA
jgi:hypothetical protein